MHDVSSSSNKGDSYPLLHLQKGLHVCCRHEVMAGMPTVEKIIAEENSL